VGTGYTLVFENLDQPKILVGQDLIASSQYCLRWGQVATALLFSASEIAVITNQATRDSASTNLSPTAARLQTRIRAA
jgi:hypothetical protein